MNLYIKRPFHIPSFKIYSENIVLLDSLRLQYGKYISESFGSGTYGIEVIRQAEDTYIVKHNGIQTVTKTPLLELDNIFFENTLYDNSVIALHGSAVEWNGKAYLFLAATTSGKTTLASWLTSSGFGYITDDCILLDRKDFTVHPYNCPIQLRDGGLEVLKTLGKAPDNLQLLDDESMRRCIYTPANCITDPLPLGKIYFIQRSETENKVCSLFSNEKITELMKSPITHYETTPEYLRLLARLSKVGCQRLIYKDMDFVTDIIRRSGEDIG